MWFGFRISSLIHLATLTITIQNQKCLKNAKKRMRGQTCSMENEDPVSHSGFRFPTQNQVWKVKHKLEELEMAIGKDKKRRSPYVVILNWSWCQVCLHKFTVHSNDRTIKAFDPTLPLTSFLRLAKWMNWRCSSPPTSTPCHPWSCSASKC